MCMNLNFSTVFFGSGMKEHNITSLFNGCRGLIFIFSIQPLRTRRRRRKRRTGGFTVKM